MKKTVARACSGLDDGGVCPCTVIQGLSTCHAPTTVSPTDADPTYLVANKILKRSYKMKMMKHHIVFSPFYSGARFQSGL